MAAGGDKGREAAGRVERGIELYASGDLAGARREFEDALKLDPQHARAAEYLGWVRDVLDGRKHIGKSKALDDDAVRAVNEALGIDLDDAPTPEAVDPVPPPRAVAVTLSDVLPKPSTAPGLKVAKTPSRSLEAQWDPVPLTPADPATTLSGLAPASATRKPGSGSQPGAPKEETFPDERSSSRRAPSNTILGVAPPSQPRIVPPKPLHEEQESVTREWNQSPTTGKNLPPLDVPELSEEQIAELAALDTSPLYGGAGERNTTVDAAPLPDDDDVPPLLELTAEPTPAPSRSPLSAALVGAAEGKPPPPHDTSAEDFFDQSPTRERELRATMKEGESQHPTSPFIRSRLGDYAPALAPSVELPPLSGPQTIQDGPPLVAAALDRISRGDLTGALEMCERMLTEAGGIDACRDIHPLLEHVYRAVLGDLARLPRHGGAAESLDPRSAFLLSRIDGTLTAEDLLDVSGMPRLEAMRTLANMVVRGVLRMS